MVAGIDRASIAYLVKKAARLVVIWSPWWTPILSSATFVYKDNYPGGITGFHDYVFIVDTGFAFRHSIMDVAIRLEFALQQATRAMDLRAESMRKSHPHCDPSLIALAQSLEINSDIEQKFDFFDDATWAHYVSRDLDRRYVASFGADHAPCLPESSWTSRKVGLPDNLRAEKYLDMLVTMSQEREQQWLDEHDEQMDHDTDFDTSPVPDTGDDSSGDGSSDGDTGKTGDTTDGVSSGSDTGTGAPTPDGLCVSDDPQEGDSSLDDSGGVSDTPEVGAVSPSDGSNDDSGITSPEDNFRPSDGEIDGKNNVSIPVSSDSGSSLPDEPQNGMNSGDMSTRVDDRVEDSSADSSTGDNKQMVDGNQDSMSQNDAGGDTVAGGEFDTGDTTPGDESGDTPSVTPPGSTGSVDTRNIGASDDTKSDDTNSDGSDTGASDCENTWDTDTCADAGTDAGTGAGADDGVGSTDTKNDTKNDRYTSLEDELKHTSRDNGSMELQPLVRPEKEKDLIGLNEDEIRDVEQQVAQEIREAEKTYSLPGKGGSAVSSDYSAWSKKRLKKSKATWKKLLPKMLNPLLAHGIMNGAMDMSYAKRNNNQIDKPGQPILMGWVSYPPKVTILIDTSPSMLRVKDTVMTEFIGVLRTFFTKYAQPVTIMLADGGIQYATSATLPYGTILKKVGRTYHNSSYEFGETLKKIMKRSFSFKSAYYYRPDILVVLTDCEFYWPFDNKKSLPPSYPKTVIVSTNPYERVRDILPPWVKEKKNFIYVP